MPLFLAQDKPGVIFIPFQFKTGPQMRTWATPLCVLSHRRSIHPTPYTRSSPAYPIIHAATNPVSTRLSAPMPNGAETAPAFLLALLLVVCGLELAVCGADWPPPVPAAAVVVVG